MAPINRLRDADIKRLALCKVGANQQRIFLLKSADGEDERIAAVAQLIKEPGEDWRTAYVPVAVPGSEEKPGMFGDQESRDIWESPEEIAKAAHSFMANGGELVGKHFDDGPVEGAFLVENAVALTDFDVGETTIKEGTWYVGLQFSDPMRELVNKGEIDAVSVEGIGTRVAKGELERVPGVQNWVDRVGGFPPGNWIYRAATHLVKEEGMTISHAIPVAVNACKKLCATGDLNFPGLQQASPEHRADACKGLAEWEAMKAKAKAQSLVKDGDMLGWEMEDTTLLQRIAKRLGIGDEEAFDAFEDYDVAYVAKRAFTPEKRKELSGTGAALPHGGFPIENCQDVANAVQALGRAKNPDAAKAHIISRAKTLGCTGKLPDDWKIAKDEAGLRDQGGRVSEQMDEEALNARFEKIEGSVSEVAKSVESLTGDEGPIAKINGSLEALAKRIPEPEPEAAKPEELVKTLEKLAESQADNQDDLVKLAKAVAQLAEGESNQPEPEVTKVAKADTNGDGKFAGILFE